ncbi:MAG: condensation protein, partial [Pyrinomonadaceae bacterium]|nr:condensation protein [Pyrinomonadaceae bacterium]
MSIKDDASERRSKLSPAQRELLEKRLRGKSAGGAISQAIPRRSQQNFVPLSFSQRRLWFLDQLEPGNPFYNVPRPIRMNGALNVEALSRTLNEIVARHESLRTTFDVIEGSPVQVIAPSLSMPLPVIELGE